MTDTTAFPGQLARTRRYTLGVPRAFVLSPDGQRALFLRTRGAEDPTSCLWVVDDDGERLLVDPADLGEPGAVPPEELTRRERTREAAAGVVGFAADAALHTVAFAVDGRLWVVDARGGRPRAVRTPGPVVDPRVDPTGRRVAHVVHGALHVVELGEPARRP